TASFHRDSVVPRYMPPLPGSAEALDLMMKIVGDGATSRLYKRLVVDEKIASSAGGVYSGSGLDYGTISLYAVSGDGADLLPKIEASIDKVLAEVRESGVTEAELKRARASYIADYIYENDDQASLARRYGWGLALGRTVAQIEGWPDALGKVTVDDIKRVAGTYLDLKRSVTGYLTPSTQGERAERPAQKNRS
ncbi:insulinase family protein, partial [Hyphomicrobium sp.]|uniref:M16 family metallopeptidase n=1 Tax=Hyphomicrobium sp. TaxID=82 RepID=UPI0025C1C7D7